MVNSPVYVYQILYHKNSCRHPQPPASKSKSPGGGASGDPKKGEKIYKDCHYDFSLYLLKNDRSIRKKDLLYTKEVKRSLPRHTFKGKERCRFAINDVFVHLPTCVIRK